MRKLENMRFLFGHYRIILLQYLNGLIWCRKDALKMRNLIWMMIVLINYRLRFQCIYARERN